MIKYSSPELSRSYKIAQVIPSGAEAGFEVVFCKDTLGDFKGTAKYVINELHEF